jgi:hypothetical protein
MEAWQEGRRSPQAMFDTEDAKFLSSIGCTRQELFDFVDDLNRYGEPSLDDALEVARIRRKYFLEVLRGKPADRQASMEELPAKKATVDGIAWLPRLIAKARLKLRGELPDDLMYGCGGDRSFLAEYPMTMPAFLQLVWDSGGDDRRIIEAIKATRASGTRAAGSAV